MPVEPRRRGRPKGFYAKDNPATIQSLDRALDVLDILALNTGMSLTQVATELDQSTATMHRVLGTLEARGIVETDPQTQNWFIGPMAYRLGSAFLRRSELVERSLPEMRVLMEQTGETSNLGVEMGRDVLFIGQIETHETIRAFFPPGTLSPMHSSGIGKALLSRYSEPRMAGFLRGQTLAGFTEQTITQGGDLRADLARTQARGWAYDDEEKTNGMRCVAAPILNAFGLAVAGVSVSGPTYRMPEDRIEWIGQMVREAADRISQSMGAPTQKGG